MIYIFIETLHIDNIQIKPSMRHENIDQYFLPDISLYPAISGLSPTAGC